MKTRLLALLLFCCTVTLLQAQGFTIEDFHADVWLHKSGSFRVRETIQVNFSEQKHGIFRSIPFRYSTSATESGMAEGRYPGMDYTTYLDSIRVPGQEFELSTEDAYKKIKIGSASIYVQGMQTYQIEYTVYGAINRFKDHDEFYWNVNGTEWPAQAKQVSITVHLPLSNLKLTPRDYKCFTGSKGETNQAATVTTSPGRFEARTNQTMSAGEGLTVGLSLPKSALNHQPVPLEILAEAYIFDSIHTTAYLNPNGSIQIVEDLFVDILDPSKRILRHFGLMFDALHLDGDTSSLSPEPTLTLDSLLNILPSGIPINLPGSVSTVAPQIDLLSGEGYQSTGKHIRAYYTLWNSTRYLQGKMYYYIPWLGHFMSEPVRKASFELKWPAGYRLAPGDAHLTNRQLLPHQSSLGPQSFKGSIHQPVKANDDLMLVARLTGPRFTIATPPLRLSGDGEFFHSLHLEMKIARNGRISIKETLYPNSEAYPYSIDRPVIDQPYLFDPTPGTVLRTPTLLGNHGRYLFGGLKSNTEYYDYNLAYGPHTYQFTVLNHYNSADTFKIQHEYWLYGLLKKEGNAYRLALPIIHHLEDPVEKLTFTITLEGNPRLAAKDLTISLLGDNAPGFPNTLNYDYKSGIIRGQTTSGLATYQSVFLQINLPADSVQPSLWLETRLFVKNQTFLCIAILLVVAIAILWFIYGRDRRFTLVAEFYPPEDLTPTEVGLLYDGELQNRDILSLIYYWGAKGFLSIEEIEKNGGVADYRLVKKGKLPSSAKDFELTIFNGLFESGRNFVHVSSLNQKFYTTMGKARKQIEEHATRKNFFVPGTRAFSSFLAIFGIGFAIIGVLWGLFLLIFSTANFNYYLDALLGIGILALGSFLFSLIMFKHGPFGHKQYKKLMGFREFIDKAEKDRLRLLLDENPDYFGLTLSYAIGLGMANRWVEKFGPMLTTPPSYYQSSASTTTTVVFSAIDFNQRMTKQLNSMATNFTSTPPPPPSSRSSGGSSYSSSSSSYSSSSRSYSSSSSSSYSSRGSSGGGYGGGGGGSW